MQERTIEKRRTPNTKAFVHQSLVPSAIWFSVHGFFLELVVFWCRVLALFQRTSLRVQTLLALKVSDADDFVVSSNEMPNP